MSVKDIKQELIDDLSLIALENGWEFCKFDKNNGMLSFIKPNRDRINIFLTTLTVVTAITHPKRGKNQLYRKDCRLDTVKELLKNPRLHTGNGYRYAKD